MVVPHSETVTVETITVGATDDGDEAPQPLAVKVISTHFFWPSTGVV